MIHARIRSAHRQAVAAFVGLISLSATGLSAQEGPSEEPSRTRVFLVGRLPVWDVTGRREVREGEIDTAVLRRLQARIGVAQPDVAPLAPTNTLNVDNTTDNPALSACSDVVPNDCSLRGAIGKANGLSGGTQINLPAGTYLLTIAGGALEGPSGDNSIGDLDVRASDVSIVGAGAATTIIQQTQPNDRVLEVNPNLDPSFVFSLSGVTIRGGRETTGVGGGGIISGSTGNQTTILNCRFTDNQASGAPGGAILNGEGTLTVSGSTFDANTATGGAGDGGAILFDGISSPSNITVTNSTFSGNSSASGTSGGGAILIQGPVGTVAIARSHFVGNQASSATTGGGGAIANASTPTGTFSISFSRFAGNTAAVPANGKTLANTGGALSPGASDNWWGANAGPGTNDVVGTTVSRWLQLRHSASPNPILVTQATTLTADILGRNTGGPLVPGSLAGLPAFPVPAATIFSNAVLGTLSGASTQFVDGAASATYTAGGTGGNGGADATADSQTVTAPIAVHQPPSVTTQPTNQTACAGSAATFTAAANGFPVPTVQWQVSTNGGGTFSDIAGATSPTLSFTAAAPQNGNQFRAVFTNVVSTATSNAATLTVNVAPAVTTNPTNLTVNQGQTATFTAAASGTPAPSVQWQVSINGGATFTDIPGATTTTLSFTAAGADSGKQYRAVFTNTCGTATTTAATLTVNVPPSVTAQPTPQTVCGGSTATFTAAASGSPAPTVQWQVSTDGGGIFNDIVGATSATLSFTAAANQTGYQYHAVFTNVAGTATSNPATLTVDVAPAVTANPADLTVNAGQTATFTAAASGTPAPTVQWQVSINGGATFTDIPGATTTTLTFTAAGADSGKQYRAVFTNTCGTATTTAATLTVNVPPSVTAQPAPQTACAGSTATFTTAASGFPAPTVQWQLSTDGGGSFNDIVGATSATLSFTAAPNQNGYQYRAVFTNVAGTATSNAATLTVDVGPAVTANPADLTVFAGQTATFTAAASATPGPTVQWQVSTDGGGTFTDIPGATTTTLSFTASAGQNGYQYRAAFTNSCGTATTTAAILTVNTPVAAVARVSGDATICAGRTTTLRADFTGTVPVDITWSDGFVQNGVNASPATRDVAPAITTVYTITSISNAAGSGTASGSATVTLDPTCLSFYTVTACRLADTRNPAGASGGPALLANAPRNFPVAGICTIPMTAKAVHVVVTTVNQTDVGHLQLYAAGAPLPATSTINFGLNQARANNAVVTLGTNGEITVQCVMPAGSTGTTHFVLDVSGYFQ